MNMQKINREPWLAVNLSIFFPGIGQIYTKRMLRGFVLVFIQISLIFLFIWQMFSPPGNVILGIAFLLPSSIFYIWNLFDSYKCAIKVNTKEFEKSRKGNKDPWLAVSLSRLLPGLGHLYLKKWTLGITFLLICFILEHSGKTLLPILSFFLSILSIYHAYISSPVRRENSRRSIFILVRTICLLQLLSFFVAMYIRVFIVQTFEIPTDTMSPTIIKGDRIFVNKSIYISKKPERGDVIVFKVKNILGLGQAKKYIKRLIGLPGETIEIKDGYIYINDELISIPKISQNPYLNSSPLLQKLDIPPKGVEIPNIFFLVLAHDTKRFYLLNSSIYKLPKDIKVGEKFNFNPRGIEYIDEISPFQVELLANVGQMIEFRTEGLYIDNIKYDEPYSINNIYIIIGQYGMKDQKVKIPKGYYFVLGDNSYNSKDSRYWGFVPEADVIGRVYKIYFPIKRAGPIE